MNEYKLPHAHLKMISDIIGHFSDVYKPCNDIPEEPSTQGWRKYILFKFLRQHSLSVMFYSMPTNNWDVNYNYNLRECPIYLDKGT